jgi:hypothetical protein
VAQKQQKPQDAPGIEEDGQIAYASGHKVTRTIATSTGEIEVDFYGVSLRVGFELKTIAKDLTTALLSLFAGMGQENTIKEVVKDYKQNDGSTVREHYKEQHGIDHKLAEVKAMERAGSIRKLIESFSDPASQAALAMFVMDSARHQFKRPVTKDAATKFVNDCGADVFVEFLKGALAANSSVLGPLADRLRSLSGKAVEAMERAAEASVDGPQDQSLPPSPPE